LYGNYFVTYFIENGNHSFKGFSVVVAQQAAHVFANAYRGVDLFYHTGKFIEERSPGIFKAQAFARVAECLAGESTGYDLHFVFVFGKIKVFYVAFQDIPMWAIVSQGLAGVFVYFVEGFTF